MFGPDRGRGQISLHDIDAITDRFPYFVTNRERRRIINPRIHIELRMILHLSLSLLTASSMELLPPDVTQRPLVAANAAASVAYCGSMYSISARGCRG